MSDKQYERIVEWVKNLSTQEMRELLPTLIQDEIMAEQVSFHDGCLAPYWSNTGDPIVDGQKVWEDE